MSRTFSKRHEAPGKTARRGPKNRPAETSDEKFKPPKQRRSNDRAALRKTWKP